MRSTPLALALIMASAPSGASAQDAACGWLEWGMWRVGSPGMNFDALAGTMSGYTPVLSWLLCGPTRAGLSSRYWQFEGTDIGSRQRTLRVEVGEYGRYRVWAEQRQIASPTSAGFTPFVNSGSATLQLPGDWLAATSTAGMARLLPSLAEVRLGGTRRRNEVGARWQWPGEWRADWRYRQDDKQGLVSVAGLIGTGGGNSRAIQLPMPVDSRTSQFDASVSHVGTRWQWQGSVLLSTFDNGNSALRWQNPFARVAGWAAGSGYPAEGQLQTAPDNRYLRLGTALAYRISDRTRLTADLGLGRATQNQAFLPYSVNPLLAASVIQPLPRNSFDGRVDSTTLRLRLNSQPFAAWRWSVDYALDDRDNRSPQDEYLMISGDAQNQNVAINSATRRFNLVDDYRQQRWQVEAGYRPSRRMDASLALISQQIDRSASARTNNDEQQWRMNLRLRPSEVLSAGVRYQEGRRRGGSYLGSRPFLDSHAPGYTNTVAGGWENLPGLRQFHLADRDRRQAIVYLDYQPMPGMSVGWRGSRSDDNYRASEFGLQSSHLHDQQIEWSYAAASGWSVTSFAGIERARFRQDGRAFQGGANRLPQANDPNRDWRADHDDRIRTWGLSVRREWLGRGSLALDYARSRVHGEVAVQTGSALIVAPLPPTRADLGTWELRGDWPLTDVLDVRLAWRWERFEAADWSRDGVGVNTLANIILLGEDSPDYRVGAWLLALRYRF